MPHCPHCDTPMEPVRWAEAPLDACGSCGGLWIAAEAMTKLARGHPEALAGLDDAWPNRGGRAPLDRLGPIDPATGEPLVERTFPFAPALPLLVAKSGAIFFRDGQLRALHQVLSPGTLPAPPDRLAAERERYLAERAAEEPEPVEPEAVGSVLADQWRQRGWPDRADGQTWLSWWVCGFPLRWLPLALLLPGLLWGVTLAYLEQFQWAWFWVGWPLILANVAGQAFLMSVSLFAVFFIFGQRMPLDFGECWVLMLKVVALCATVGACCIIVFALTDASIWAYRITTFVLRLVVLRLVLELDWFEVALLSIVSGVLGASIGL